MGRSRQPLRPAVECACVGLDGGGGTKNYRVKYDLGYSSRGHEIERNHVRAPRG